MGRETLLTLLSLLFGGLSLQPLAMLRWRGLSDAPPRLAEQREWLRLLLPVLPVLAVCVWLCGWALREPDPVRARFDHGMIIGASIPFALLALRAALRSVWVFVREPVDLPVCTVGLLRPRIVFDPWFARSLDQAQVFAVLEHERAHVRHRDPLRIWLAQLATDLQWPWPGAQRRFEAWLEILEHARDDEARSRGASGQALAAAVVATARQSASRRGAARDTGPLRSEAALLGDAGSLALRIRRLLAPLPEEAPPGPASAMPDPAALALLGVVVCGVFVLGAVFGNAVLHPFFLWTWTA